MVSAHSIKEHSVRKGSARSKNFGTNKTSSSYDEQQSKRSHNFNMKNSSSSHDPLARQPRPLLKKETTGSASNLSHKSSMEDGHQQFRTGSFSSNQSAESDTEIIRKPGEREQQKQDDLNKKRLKHGSLISKNIVDSQQQPSQQHAFVEDSLLDMQNRTGMTDSGVEQPQIQTSGGQHFYQGMSPQTAQTFQGTSFSEAHQGYYPAMPHSNIGGNEPMVDCFVNDGHSQIQHSQQEPMFSQSPTKMNRSPRPAIPVSIGPEQQMVSAFDDMSMAHQNYQPLSPRAQHPGQNMQQIQGYDQYNINNTQIKDEVIPHHQQQQQQQLIGNPQQQYNDNDDQEMNEHF